MPDISTALNWNFAPSILMMLLSQAALYGYLIYLARSDGHWGTDVRRCARDLFCARPDLDLRRARHPDRFTQQRGVVLGAHGAAHPADAARFGVFAAGHAGLLDSLLSTICRC